MKKLVSVFLVIAMMAALSLCASADFREPVDGIKMSPGFNPVVMHIDDHTFQYALYARDMEKMTNADLKIHYAENLTPVACDGTGNYAMCSVYDTGTSVNVSFVYESQNNLDSVKLFVLTFVYTGEVVYPTVEVTNIAGTFIKKVAEVVVIDYDGENDLAVSTIPGDIDLNGEVTAADARLALRYSSKVETLTEQQLRNADVNNDGRVTASDARLILRVAAGLDSEIKA